MGIGLRSGTDPIGDAAKVPTMPPERDLLASFERMRRDIDELFGDFFEPPAFARHRRGGFVPPVDVSYADDPPRACVTVALPGVRIEEVDLEVRGRELLIAGVRRPPEPEGRAFQQIEIAHGPFRRIVDLGVEVVAERTRATYEDGMLQVELPLVAPEQRVRTVPIEASLEEQAEPSDADSGRTREGRRP
jgi:HSP20 family protein